MFINLCFKKRFCQEGKKLTMKPTMLCVYSLMLLVCSVSAAENTIAKEWVGKKADIYFILDSSFNIFGPDYTTMKTFVSDMVSGMDIGPDKTRVGVGLFSDKYREDLPLNNTRDKDSLVDAIKEAPHYNQADDNGRVYLSRGIEGVRKIGLSPDVTRKGVPSIAVLFTVGKSRHHQLTIDNVTLAKREGMYIYTVGIGRDVNSRELKFIASDPKDDFAYTTTNFDTLIESDIKKQMMTSMSEVEFLQEDEGTCGKKEVADVVFVYDEYALGREKTSMVEGFIKSLVKEFSMDSGKIRISIMSKTCHRGDITLGEYLTQADLLNAMANQRGPTVRALFRKARLDGFQPKIGGRSHAKTRIILFLEGTVVDFSGLSDEARRAKYTGKRSEVFIVAIDATVPKGFLEDMASDDSYITHVNSFSELKNAPQRFLKTFCSDLN